MPIRCHNRPPYLDTHEVQAGWNADGTRRTVVVQNNNSKSCMFDLKLTQPGCQGCRWQTQMDPRDAAR